MAPVNRKKNGYRRILTCSLCLAVLFCVMAGCGEEDMNPDNYARTIKAGVLRIDDSIPLYVADRDGLFEIYGVRVELIEFGSASDQIKAAEAGEIDFLMTDMVVLCLLKKGGADFRAVTMALGANAGEGRFLVVSAPESGIYEPSDLHGATIAISENTMMDYLVEQYEIISGLNSNEIEKLHIPNLSLRLDTLLEGQVDAAILPDPLAAFAAAHGANVVIDDTDLGVNLSQSVFVASSRLIAEDPDLVEILVEALGAAMEKINNSPDDYREFCLEVANVPAEISGDYPVPSYTPNAVPGSDEVQRVVDWMLSRGLLQEGFAYDEIVDDSFI